MLATKYSECSATSYQVNDDDDEEEEEEDSESGSRDGVMARYYGLTSHHANSSSGTNLTASSSSSSSSNSCVDVTMFPKKMLRSLSGSGSGSGDVLLEPGSVPTMVVLSAGDDALFDYRQEQELLALFRVDSGEENSGGGNGGDGGDADDAHSFLRLRYNMSRVAQTSDEALNKALWWTDTFV
jgi:hypothetical protein